MVRFDENPSMTIVLIKITVANARVEGLVKDISMSM